MELTISSSVGASRSSSMTRDSDPLTVEIQVSTVGCLSVAKMRKSTSTLGLIQVKNGDKTYRNTPSAVKWQSEYAAERLRTAGHMGVELTDD